MKLFLAKNGLNPGPYDPDQIREMIAATQLSMEDMVWIEGTETWRPLRECPGVVNAVSGRSSTIAPPVVDQVEIGSSAENTDGARPAKKRFWEVAGFVATVGICIQVWISQKRASAPHPPKPPPQYPSILSSLSPSRSQGTWRAPMLAPTNLGTAYYGQDRAAKKDFPFRSPGSSANDRVQFGLEMAEAGKGNAIAQYNIGVRYATGQGVVKDPAEAAKWYRRAAELGDAEAQFNLGWRYGNGDGVAQSYTEALKWYRKAAEQNNAAAQFNLGAMYYNGQGVEQDYAQAARWGRKAAEQNFAKAQYNLGTLYELGRGVAKDDAEAVKWYRRAAEQDYVSAQFNLGGMYYNGRGVEKNYVEALAWYDLAATSLDFAVTNRDVMEMTMPPGQIAEARKRTKELRAMIDARAKSKSEGQ